MGFALSILFTLQDSITAWGRGGGGGGGGGGGWWMLTLDPCISVAAIWRE